MPYSGKVLTSVPNLPHYINPNSVINLTLSSYIDTCSVGDTIGEVKYTDSQNEDPEEIITADLICSTSGSSSYFDTVLDGQIILRVEINHVANTSQILVDNWRDYESTTDFDRFVIYAIDLDWE